MSERYKDLESLILKGFIPLKVKIADTNFVFKTINDNEYEQIELRSGLRSDKNYLVNFHLNYLYYSVYMINGNNLLINREEHYTSLIDIFRGYTSFFVKKIFSILTELNKRIEVCSQVLEAYSYEDVSRYNWNIRKNFLINSTNLTGILGTENLGINDFQKYWIAINLKEDNVEKFQDNYSLFKFLASFWDSKQVKKIESIEKQKKEEEVKRKEKVKTGVREDINYLSIPTDTEEGLLASLEQQIKGEKDEHDKVIEQHEKNIRTNMLKHLNELKKMQEVRRKLPDFNLEESRAISQEEMNRRIRSKEFSKKIHTLDKDLGMDKYNQMSNVKDEDILKENILTDEEYNELKDSEIYKSLHDVPEEDYTKEYYDQEQRRLAVDYGFEKGSINPEQVDFPNLRNR